MKAKYCTCCIKWFCDKPMQANPEKFQAIAIGEKTFNENIFDSDGNM